MGSWGPKLSSCGQRRLWSDWADAQADLSLCWAHSHFVGFVRSRLKYVVTVEQVEIQLKQKQSKRKSLVWNSSGHWPLITKNMNMQCNMPYCSRSGGGILLKWANTSFQIKRTRLKTEFSTVVCNFTDDLRRLSESSYDQYLSWECNKAMH